MSSKLKAGIVGLPNVGKSTLFNLLTKQRVEAKNFPFTTIDPNVSVVPVPDKRVDELVKIFEPKSVVPAVLEVVDIAGLIKGAAKGEGLGNKFLSHIREVDAIIHVVRVFQDDQVLHVHGKTDPLNDIDIIKTELELADLDHPEAPKLSEKPTIYALNVDEVNQTSLELADEIKAKTGSKVIALNFVLDEESGLAKLIRTVYETLGLISFFTAGKDEVRAWTIRVGALAPEAAGKIHDDMRRGFIAADIINFDEFEKLGSFEAARAAGKIRSEGKDYEISDGDIAVFKFNV